jgi:hypothetical protein
MAIILNDNLKINVGKPVDSKYLNGLVPYADTSEVLSVIPIAERYIGLTVNVDNEEYWFKDDLTTLVEKFQSFTGGTVVTDADNIGGGAEVYSGKFSATSGDTLQFRSFVGSGNTLVSQVGSEIVIFSSGTTGNFQPIYTGASPSNIDAGGMPSGTELTGRTLSEIIEDIAIATFTPTLVAPSNTFTDNQSATKEVGVLIPTIQFTATFDQGAITPQYPPTSSDKRSGLPNTYNYTGTGLPSSVASAALSDVNNINNYTVLLGSNTWSGSVSYDAGVQPYDSNGDPFDSPLPAGTTGSQSHTITGIYPWFYGKSAAGTRPTANQALINAGTKLVAGSTGTISVPNYNAVGEWIWFAIPSTSTSKTVWEGSNSPSNTGAIGGAVSAGGNLFPDPDVVSIDSPTSLWSGVNYKIYVSNFQTSTFDGGSPYTLTFKNS